MSNTNEIRQLTERLTVALTHDNLLPEDEAREAAFHISDWLSDFRALSKLISNDGIEPTLAQEVLLLFLHHAPAHIAAAAKIVTDSPVIDIFEIGAVEGDGVAKRKAGMKPWTD